VTRPHLLVTNDYPPKHGGIQNYLWELWRRLDPTVTGVMTTPYDGAARFDAREGYPIDRSPEPWLGPWPWLLERIRRQADRLGSELVLFDPAFPLGALAPWLGRPYGVVLHGAEVTIPGRLPVSSSFMARTLGQASLVVSAGEYALREAERCARRSLPAVVIPPGVDHDRFRPLEPTTRQRARARWGVTPDEILVVSVSRLVPRKGMDNLIDAVARAEHLLGPSGPRLKLIIGGDGRQADALRRQAAQSPASITLTGRLSNDDIDELYGAADVMAMLCNERLRGLEQEGFGIVFLEAAACGVPQIAGRSGGAHEAVEHGVTGLIVDDPRSAEEAARAIVRLVQDPELRATMGDAARRRAVERFDYQRLADELQQAIDGAELR
jgi:phosphatidylinositol alpha-1,6-mannosyltransferase